MLPNSSKLNASFSFDDGFDVITNTYMQIKLTFDHKHKKPSKGYL